MNRTFRRTLTSVVFACAAALSTSPASAKKAAPVAAEPASPLPAAAAPPVGTTVPAKGTALAAVRAANATIAKQLAQKPAPGSAEEAKLAKAVTETVRNFIDFDILATRAIHETEWAAATEGQRKEYLVVLRALLEANYVRGMRSNLAFTVDYIGEFAAPVGNAVIVQTVIKAKRKGRPISIKVDYTVETKIAGGVGVVDIATDGVGLIANYREQFTKIIKKDGFDGLLTKMKKKQATTK